MMQIQKTDLVEQVYDTIKEGILSGRLAPLETLRQEELADTMGVSRQPVSHAMVILERDGLVVDKGRKGKMVAPIDPDQILSLYQVRGALDGLAARLAAERISQTGINQLNQFIEQGQEAVLAHDKDALAISDIAFHRALYQLSENPEIARIADASWAHMVRSMHRVLEDDRLYQQIWSDHAAIADAIIKHNPDEAARLASHHAESSGQATYQRLSEGQALPQ